MTAPLVSVLIPCFNAERTIGETLESVLAQTWPNIETIVVDDGSMDGSAEVVRSYISRGMRGHLGQQPNRGQTVALNAALQRATGDFIQFLDADDLISPRKIELQMSRLASASDCVASSEWGRFYTHPSETKFIAETVWQDMEPLDWLAESRRNGLGMMFPALWLVPKALSDRIGPWRGDLTLNNDAEYFSRVLLASRRVLFCQGARCHYRSGVPGSLSGRKTEAAWNSQFKALDACESMVLAQENSERMRRAFALSWQHFAHHCYPYNRNIAECALERGRRLHAARISPDGGNLFRAASKALGWRLARRLQVLSGRP